MALKKRAQVVGMVVAHNNSLAPYNSIILVYITQSIMGAVVKNVDWRLG